MVNKMIDTFQRARSVGTPLISITTPDAAATITNMVPHVEWVDEEKADQYDEKGNLIVVPMVRWDSVQGLVPLNEDGKKIIPDGQKGAAFSGKAGLIDTVNAALSMFVGECVVFGIHVNRYLEASPGSQNSEAATIQAIWNARDRMKERGQTFIMLGPAFQMPVELRDDVLALDEPLPDRAAIHGIVDQVYASFGMGEATDVEDVIDGMVGMAAFPAEQAAFMSVNDDGTGIDTELLWTRKKGVIDRTKGLSIYQGGEGFDDLAGYANAKSFIKALGAGPRKPKVIVFIDEIEKAMAGIAGDNTGISQDYLGEMLSFMEDTQASGQILIGPPGTGKSQFAKAAGVELGIPTIKLDLGGMKGSLVGQSEQALRDALKVVDAVSDGRPFFIATSNDLGILPAALRRRYKMGTVFFDLPTADELPAIWEVWLGRFGLVVPHDDMDALVEDSPNWTGSDVQSCCEIAFSLGSTLAEAATYFVPVNVANREDIKRLRNDADGRYVSASYPGMYQIPEDDRYSTASDMPIAPVSGSRRVRRP